MYPYVRSPLITGYAKTSTGSGTPTAVLPGPLPNVSSVVILGASISDGVVSGKTQLMSRAFKNNGLDITVHDESTGGRHVDEILTHWDSVKSGYAAGGDSVLCFSHCLGNDVSGFHPYSSMSEADVSGLVGEVNALMSSISGNGNVPVLVEATFRGYDNDISDGHTWYNEDNGSLPFNENIINPISKLLEPYQFWTPTDSPSNSDYNWSYNYGYLLLEDAVDRIHYTSEGSSLLRRLWVDNMSAMIKGEDPVTFTKKSAAAAVGVQRTPKEFIIGESSTTATGPNTSIPDGNYWRITADNVDEILIPIDGYTPNSITISSTADVLTHSTNSSYLDDGVYTATLDNFSIKKAYGYTFSETYVELYKLSGFYANQPVSIGMASYKDSTENRIIEFMFNDDSVNTLTCNAKIDSGSNVQWGDYTADANGEITVKAKKNGGYVAHWNGMHVIPL